MAGFWIPDLMPKQLQLFNDFEHRYILLEGCRLSGKTRASLHRIARHMWETDRAEVGIFVRTTRSAKNSGIWDELCCTVIEEWQRNGYFFGKWVKPGPHTSDGVTKIPLFTLRSSNGSISRCSLFNCEDDTECERKVRGTRFSMIYFPELGNFLSRSVFDATKSQLRCLHLPYEYHLFLADCNPTEEGEASWIYRLWLVEKFLPPKNDDEKAFRDQLHSIHFQISDNTKIDPREMADLRASYEYSPDLYSRYIEGKWTASSENSHFVDLFIENIHVVGQAHGSNKDNWEVVTPDEGCHELITGWDMGDVNHAAVIIQKRVVNNEVSFDVLDELVFLKEKISIEDFALEMLEKMDAWEKYIREEYGTRKIAWRHWSDSSAFQYRSASDSHDELIVRNATEGRIMLGSAPKAKGSVKMRVNLMRKLLFQKRIFFSAQLFATLGMIKGLKRGTTIGGFVDPLDKNKHVFDALTYALLGEAPLDAQNRSRPKVERRSSVVTVGV